MTYLITGGAGSMGRELVKHLLNSYGTTKVIVYSRDEYKHAKMAQEIDDKRMRYIIGDIRDVDRITRACKGVDRVIHTAALKRVPEGQYNPTEFIKTNIQGTENVISACANTDVQRAVFLSTDKACEPINLYGKTKATAEEVWLQANVEYRPIFNVTRYGNVLNSTGSVVPYFRQLVDGGATSLPVTWPNMTRFAMTFEQAVLLVMYALNARHPQQIFVAKAPSFSMIRLCEAFGCEIDVVGMRPAEKMHEVLIGRHESARAYEYDDHYVITPELPYDDEITFCNRKPIEAHSEYNSYDNPDWLTVDELKELI
jgi:UDP-N-acetylglucosamine 4,6-dehydratase/5-epimerase